MKLKLAIHYLFLCLCGAALMGVIAAAGATGIGLSSVIWGLFLVALMAGLWLTRGAGGKRVVSVKPDTSALTSLVLLNRRPRVLDRAALEQKVRRAWGDEGASAALEGEPPTFFLRVCEHTLAVHNFALPYFLHPDEVAASVDDREVQQIIMTHGGWTSVDLIESQELVDVEQVYRLIGLLLAELSDEEASGIYWPETGELRSYGAATRERLGSGAPLEVFSAWGDEPLAAMPADDPRMRSAAAEARRTWPQFLEAFENRWAPQVFSIKAIFGEGSSGEALWMIVSAIENDVVYGALINRGMHCASRVLGARVNVPADRVVDWMYTDRGRTRGGFLIEALRRSRQRDVQRYE